MGTFSGTFLASWLLLDLVVTSPPTVVSASAALAASTTVLTVGQLALGVDGTAVPKSLGLARAGARAAVVAGLVGCAYFVSLVPGAQILGVSLELRSSWATVLLASLIFHGLAEELAWRGFVVGRLRSRPDRDRHLPPTRLSVGTRRRGGSGRRHSFTGSSGPGSCSSAPIQWSSRW
jgi:membrane protease YdiL (CAAX protease family)